MDEIYDILRTVPMGSSTKGDVKMNTFKIVPAKTDADLKEIATLAEEIWHQHFTPIIGKDQVIYMVDKFQSYPAIKGQTENGYEYFKIYNGEIFAGYTGVHEENGSLFLSKLYLHESQRGQHLSTKAFHFLVELCKERGLDKIWLTCNRNNSHTLDVYHHLGFETVREEKADIGNGFYMDDYILEYVI